MVVAVAYDETLINPSIENLKATPTWKTGLLIGQISAKRTLIVALIPTPADGLELSNLKDAKQVLDQIKKHDITFAVQHAKQVLRLLPGGLHVVGVFWYTPFGLDVAGPSKALQISLAKLDAHSTMLQLHICPQSLAMTCLSFETKDLQAKQVPATWQPQPFATQFLTIRSQLEVNLDLGLPANATSKAALQGLQSFEALVENAVVSVNGVLATTDRGVTAVSKDQQYLGCIYLPTSTVETQPRVSHVDAQTTLRLHGTISSEALVHSKATLKETAAFVKEDLIRCLRARVGLMCEAYCLEGSPSDITNQNLPRRVYWPFTSHIHFCDYAFDAEDNTTFAELKAHVHEVLGISEPTMLESTESFRPHKKSPPSISITTNPVKAQGNSPFILMVFVALLAVVLAVVVLK